MGLLGELEQNSVIHTTLILCFFECLKSSKLYIFGLNFLPFFFFIIVY